MEKLNSKELETCLGEDEIEAYLLQKQYLPGTDEEWISAHIHSCYECFTRYFDLLSYHDILKAELEKPVSRQIIKLVKGLQST